MARARMAAFGAATLAAMVGGVLLVHGGGASSAPAVSPGAPSANVQESYGKLPLRFEENRGQTDKQVDFLARGAGYALFLTPRESVLSLSRTTGTGPKAKTTSAVLRMGLVGANANARPAPIDRLPGETNYLRGGSAESQTHVRGYGRVSYRSVYPGTDLVYYGKQGKLEYDFRLAPGADPSRIALDFSGARKLTLDASGNLKLHTRGGTVVHEKPVVYQPIAGRRHPVPARFVVRPGNRVSFKLGAYDRSRLLVIDPVVVYSTFLGGSARDSGVAIAADSAGNAYVTGWTQSPNFPTQASLPAGGPPNRDRDVFVTKLNPSGSALVYSTYLGGMGFDEGNAIAVDAAGAAYIAGSTDSDDFPGTTGGFEPTNAGSDDGFVAKLVPSGASLAYTGYLGGTSSETPSGVDVDSAGSAYVTGRTFSEDFPTVNALQPVSGGDVDGFVTKINPAGSALVYSTYLGGSGGRPDHPEAIRVDSAGSAYLAGATTSPNFPITAGAFDETCGTDGQCNDGTPDAFASKLNATGSALVYSTFLGSSGEDSGVGIAVGRGAADFGRAYVFGFTTSTDYPTSDGAFDRNFGGALDYFVTKLNAAGSALDYSTVLGGSGEFDEGVTGGIAVDAGGGAIVVGTSFSSDFPIVRPVTDPVTVQATRLNVCCGTGFAARLKSDGSGLSWSTGLGPVDRLEVAADPAGAAYMTGITNAAEVPTQSPFQAHNASVGFGEQDEGFVAKLAPDDPQAPYVTGLSHRGDDAAGGRAVRITGLGLDDVDAVSFGGAPATRFDILSPTELVAIAPAHSEADSRVTVSDRGHTSPPNPNARFVYAEGRWSVTGSPPPNVSVPSLVLLKTGTVLTVEESTASLYDPKTGTWAPTAQPPLDGAPVLLSSGKVLSVGAGDAALYDPLTATWTPTAGNPTVAGSPRTSFGVRNTITRLQDGRVLITNNGQSELYNPATDSFSPAGALPAGIDGDEDDTATLLLNGKVLVTGGDVASSPPPTPKSALYDPVAGTWTEAAGLSQRRSSHSATRLLGGKVLVTGGVSRRVYLDTAELYDPATDTWTPLPRAEVRRSGIGPGTVLLPSGKVLIAGGEPGCGPPERRAVRSIARHQRQVQVRRAHERVQEVPDGGRALQRHRWLRVRPGGVRLTLRQGSGRRRTVHFRQRPPGCGALHAPRGRCAHRPNAQSDSGSGSADARASSRAGQHRAAGLHAWARRRASDGERPDRG